MSQVCVSAMIFAARTNLPILCVFQTWHCLHFRKDRVTIQEKEREVLHQRELEQTARRQADERRRETLKVI